MENKNSVARILKGLDDFLHKNDYASAEKYLLSLLAELEKEDDFRILLLLKNELMGLYRKLGREADALSAADSALRLVRERGLERNVGAATTYLNSATVYKAFGRAAAAIPLFERARAIYESDLPKNDIRLSGLYNNMALALVDIGNFAEATALYQKAIAILEKKDDGAPEIAVTYLNLASAAEAEHGALDADEAIRGYLDRAKALLDGYAKRDGRYAFVCEKCATVFGYYGYFLYEKELKERARRIYGI